MNRRLNLERYYHPSLNTFKFPEIYVLINQVGAGIQIPSNSTRLLSRLGLDPYLEKYVTEPEVISFRRWESGDVIGLTRLTPDFRNVFDAPYYVIHRADFHTALHQRALDLGVKVQLASRVTEYNPHGPSIHFENGTAVSADLIVAADGSFSCVTIYELA